MSLLHLLDASELDPRKAPSLRGGHAGTHMVVDELVEVKPKFGVEFALQLFAPP